MQSENSRDQQEEGERLRSNELGVDLPQYTGYFEKTSARRRISSCDLRIPGPTLNQVN